MNIIKNADFSLIERRIVIQIYFFFLQNRMKWFHWSMIKRATFFTIRKSETHFLSSCNIFRWSILSATITVKNYITWITLIFPGFCQCWNNKRTIHFSSITVTNDFSCTNIQNTCKISPTMLYCVNICNVWQPYLVRFTGMKVLICQILKFGMLRLFIAVISEFSDR